MKALLLAAGKATRLGSLSATTPKCLQKVGEVALLDRIVCQLVEAGVSELLINVHHLADQVIDHIEQSSFADRTTIVAEERLLGTLGTLRANIDFFGCESGWVLHADNLLTTPLTPFRDAFVTRPEQAWGSVLAFVTEDPSACGVMLVDEQDIVTDFFEKVPSPPSDLASAATFIFDDRMMRLVESLPEDATDMSCDLLPRCIGRLQAFRYDGQVIDIGTPARLSQANALSRGNL